MAEGPKLDKIKLTDMWRRDGRHDEVVAYRTRVRHRLKKEGKLRAEALERSWEAARDAFPPIRPPPEDAKTKGKGAAASQLPKSWSKLPASAPFGVEVEWVHQNRVLVVEERSAGKSVLHWDRAQKSAPSYGAVNLMEYAATNRKGFMDILQRVNPGDAGEEQNVRREKRSINDIEALLDQMAELS